MATVYLAQDLRHDRPVALKVLHPELAATLGPERFQREIRLAARLQHPHILTVLDSGETGGPALVHDAVRRGREPARPACGASGSSRWRTRSASPAKRRTRSSTPTSTASSTGTSSRRTSSSPATATTLVADFGIARALGGRRAADRDRAGHRHAGLHEPGAGGGRPRARRPHRHLLARPSCCTRCWRGSRPSPDRRRRPSWPSASASRRRASAASGQACRRRLTQAIRKALAPVAADRFATAGRFAQALQTTADSARPRCATAATRRVRAFTRRGTPAPSPPGRPARTRLPARARRALRLAPTPRRRVRRRRAG